ncbi:MAG: hypothetical protein ACYDCC_04835 [Actinomycetota bacterium]
MPTYEFVGDDERYFPSLGVTLKPGDKHTTEAEVTDALLRAVSEAPTPKPKKEG